MVVAVPIEHTKTAQLQTGLGIAFRIKFHQLNPIRGDEGNKGNVVLLRHGMINGKEEFILHSFNADGMIFIRSLGFQGRQCDAAAADHGISGAVDDIAANGADVEFGSQHIGRGVPVDDMFAVHQFDEGNDQSPGQRLQQRNVRQTLGSLPF